MTNLYQFTFIQRDGSRAIISARNIEKALYRLKEATGRVKYETVDIEQTMATSEADDLK